MRRGPSCGDVAVPETPQGTGRRPLEFGGREPRTKRQNGRRSWTASRRPILNDLPPDVDAQGPGRREERRRAGAGPRGVGPRELVRRRYPDPQARLLTSRAASHAYPVALIRSRGGVRAA
ncbi:hypothetical protein NDU88_004166 [Pleurodeles waltl]|uniref:Uncharacterized protein n=1 Tax=Pleurodeles waltl TaxID=8319 RepID=A0AAV7NK89_PLEWA|nr:hypothetical protein NDU88_004166 [Pleurodeles waltl]